MSRTYENYKFIRNFVQLEDVKMHSLDVKSLDGQHSSVTVNLQRSANDLVSENGVKKVEIFLRTHIYFKEEGPWEIELVYKGICSSKKEVSQEELLEYANKQVVSLLLPYARECVTSVLSRMQMAPYYLPTMDILGSIEENFIYL